MFRVNQTHDRRGIVVNVDGQLVGEYVEVAAACCAQALAAGERVSLFLHEVSAIDEAGRELLKRLARQGVHLLGSGVYTCHLIESIRHTRS